jgi:hypothetical protein
VAIDAEGFAEATHTSLEAILSGVGAGTKRTHLRVMMPLSGSVVTVPRQWYNRDSAAQLGSDGRGEFTAPGPTYLSQPNASRKHSYPLRLASALSRAKPGGSAARPWLWNSSTLPQR